MRLLRASILSVTLLLLLQGNAAWSATDSGKTIRVALLPLDVVRTGQFSYLGNSVEQMLHTRLGRFDNITVVTNEVSGTQLNKLNQELKTNDFHAAIKHLQVDWIADGSVYALKQGVQINMTLYPASEDGKPSQFGVTAAKAEDISSALTSLTADIGRVVTGAADNTADGTTRVKTGNDGMEAFRTPHPELAYKKGLYAAGGLTGDLAGRYTTSHIQRSSTIPMTAETMVVTDLDGDGKDDIIVASQSDIRIFHYGEYHFDQVAEYRFKLNKKIHALSVLPAAQGTTAHLLVSADGKNLPSSVIMSWNGSNTLQVEHNAIRWYVRAVTMPGKGTFIAGQQLKPGTDQWQLAPYIYRLVLNEQSGKLMNKGRLALPEGITLFDFVYADLNNDKKIETVVIDAHQKLLLYNSSNELIWVSSTNYGGGLSHFGPSLNAHVSDEEAGGRILNYIPGRLEVSDLDNDGSWEIIVNTNTVDSKLLRFFPNLRHFNSGAVSCLGWNDGALQELWRTNTINGYVADYAFKSGADAGSPSPAGNSGRLFVVQTQGKSLLQRLLPGSDTSKIFMYALEIAPSEE